MLSKNEEDYLKALFHLIASQENDRAGTNQLAQQLDVKPASANSMLKKLKTKGLVDYKKYGKLSLTSEGRVAALLLIRKHRLWETFLHQKLGFSWDEVHEVAEQLEHIRSEKLIEMLDRFLGFPESDPHGDPIPDAQGNMNIRTKKTLAEVQPGESCRIAGVKDTSAAFLQYLTQLGLRLDSQIKVLEIIDFDHSMRVALQDGREIHISEKFSQYVFVQQA
ncbi:MAG: metal-dependent transcriptional regulator [Saprospiraceae bacterium]|jgi:DtxR family Mn-dependent transcriptional regulator|nr:metal-dependent transcriptional regulator [Saprospiraceae bacterium]HRD82812.1 metal-dependent transcriptional regulator [Saprospiraceae bacterium]HRF40047.1 metal-dependent transcriptional regulator [Saprospiraceae bacterium]HRJ13512.1 metal-dependent transcriptional regulator [Saprospiraceae bacterium]HRK81894.1 metal-dependent transcriptional regulator [Saprospiraceae bacterium]